MGEQKVAAAAASKTHPTVSLCKHCWLAETQRAEPDGGACPYFGKLFFYQLPEYSAILLHIKYQLRSNICRRCWHNEKYDG